MAKLVDISEVLLELGVSAAPTELERAVTVQAIKRAEGAILRVLRYDPVQATRTEYYPMKDYDPLGGQGVWEASSTTAFLRRTSQASSDELQVRHLPIRSITSLAIDYDGRSDTRAGSFTDTKSEGDDFWPNYDGVDASSNKFCSDGIIRSVGLWPSTPGSVKIIYVAGYTEDELRGSDKNLDATAIWESALIESTRRARATLTEAKKSSVGFLSGVIESEKLGDYSYKIASASIGQDYTGKFDLLPETTERLSDFINYGWQLEG